MGHAAYCILHLTRPSVPRGHRGSEARRALRPPTHALHLGRGRGKARRGRVVTGNDTKQHDGRANDLPVWGVSVEKEQCRLVDAKLRKLSLLLTRAGRELHEKAAFNDNCSFHNGPLLLGLGVERGCGGRGATSLLYPRPAVCGHSRKAPERPDRGDLRPLGDGITNAAKRLHKRCSNATRGLAVSEVCQILSCVPHAHGGSASDREALRRDQQTQGAESLQPQKGIFASLKSRGAPLQKATHSKHDWLSAKEPGYIDVVAFLRGWRERVAGHVAVVAPEKADDHGEDVYLAERRPTFQAKLEATDEGLANLQARPAARHRRCILLLSAMHPDELS